MRIASAAVFGLALLMCAAGCCSADDVFHNITAVETKQMSNAVQIVVKADGVIAPNMDMLEYEFTNYGRLQQNGWRFDLETTEPMDYVTLHLENARLQADGLVPVGKYPISHVSFTPTTNGGSSRVDMAVFLYTPALISHIKSRYWDDTSVPGTDWGNNVRMEIILGEDERSVLITVISDRGPDTADHRKAEGLKDTDKELSISFEGELFDVHARNVPLSDFVRRLKSVSGRRVELDASVERLVTAELPKIGFDDLIRSVCKCYGLASANQPDGEILLHEAVVQSDGRYGRQESQTIRLQSVRADDALGLLPNFLTRCVRVDTAANQLVFSGTPEFAEKLRADLALIDRPSKTVEIEASLVEVSPTLDVNAVFGLSYGNAELSALVEAPAAQFGIVASQISPAEFAARLTALEESAMAKGVSSARLKVLSGEEATLFAGVDKYIQVRDHYGERERAIPVNAGLNVAVQPVVTGGRIQLELNAEVSNINVIDPVTSLPVVDTRKAEGRFQIEPGECIVIGGLDGMQTHIERRRLPILGHLPIIGSLFTRTIKHHEHSRLVLLLTSRIVEDSVATSL